MKITSRFRKQLLRQTNRPKKGAQIDANSCANSIPNTPAFYGFLARPIQGDLETHFYRQFPHQFCTLFQYPVNSQISVLKRDPGNFVLKYQIKTQQIRCIEWDDCITCLEKGVKERLSGTNCSVSGSTVDGENASSDAYIAR